MSVNPPHTLATPIVSIEENDAIRNAQSFLEIFYHRERLHPDKPYLRQPQGKHWQEYSWQEVGKLARRLLTVLRDNGLQPGDHVGLLSKNCYQWVVADLAILMGGFVSVPFYPTLAAEDLEEVIALSHIKALFVGKLEHWHAQQAGVHDDILTIAFPHYPGNSMLSCDLDWDHIMQHYQPAELVHTPTADEVFTLIYTSGTTGTPKGVMLNYACCNAVMEMERREPAYGLYQGIGERVLSYLPLNHIAERVLSEVSPIVTGSEVSFSESLDLFVTNLQAVQPTQFFAVPRIWSKIQQGILAKLPQRKLDFLLAIPLLNTLIQRKIKHGIGLAEVRSAISGAAPISASVLEWFANLDIHIQEVYGATELCGGVAYNTLDDIHPGTVGKAVPGVDIKIDPDSDEVLVKAPWVMLGYYQDPEKTAEVFQDDFYRTGDTGRLDEDGRLIITGRLKDTFKTAKGKFVLPVPIEQELGSNFLIEQVMVTGFGLPQPIALVSLADNAAALSEDDLENQLQSSLTELNQQLDAASKVSHLVVFKTAWSEDSGYFTPTLKIKRHAVNAAFSSQYPAWSASNKTIVWVDQSS